jgi:hypothetical protein
MLRKTILAVAASAALGAAALAPSAASAFGGHPVAGHWRGHAVFRPGIRVYAGPVVYNGCVVRRWVYTPHGPVLRWVNRCY